MAERRSIFREAGRVNFHPIGPSYLPAGLHVPKLIRRTARARPGRS